MNFSKPNIGCRKVSATLAALAVVLPFGLVSPCLCAAASCCSGADAPAAGFGCCGSAVVTTPSEDSSACPHPSRCCGNCDNGRAVWEIVRHEEKRGDHSAEVALGAEGRLPPQNENVDLTSRSWTEAFCPSPLRLHALLGVWLN